MPFRQAELQSFSAMCRNPHGILCSHNQSHRRISTSPAYKYHELYFNPSGTAMNSLLWGQQPCHKDQHQQQGIIKRKEISKRSRAHSLLQKNSRSTSNIRSSSLPLRPSAQLLLTASLCSQSLLLPPPPALRYASHMNQLVDRGYSICHLLESPP